jgi:hypothetical protein
LLKFAGNCEKLAPNHHPQESYIFGSTTNGTSGKMSKNALFMQLLTVTVDLGFTANRFILGRGDVFSAVVGV